ncbi:MAG: hypothetical protein LKI39_16375, partial [Bacteroides sp.]|nr:hypothetical protein [Bacteroides sp.]
EKFRRRVTAGSRPSFFGTKSFYLRYCSDIYALKHSIYRESTALYRSNNEGIANGIGIKREYIKTKDFNDERK